MANAQIICNNGLTCILTTEERSGCDTIKAIDQAMSSAYNISIAIFSRCSSGG